jgi:hypothetical protein
MHCSVFMYMIIFITQVFKLIVNEEAQNNLQRTKDKTCLYVYCNEWLTQKIVATKTHLFDIPI